MIIKWIKCHIFGRHDYQCDVEKISKYVINVSISCEYCNFEHGGNMRLYKLKKVDHLTVIEKT